MTKLTDNIKHPKLKYKDKCNLKKINGIKDKGLKIVMLCRLLGKKNQQINFLNKAWQEEKANNNRKIQIEIQANNDIEAFGAFVDTEKTDSKATILINFTSLLFVCAENPELNYKELFADTVVHEMLHMVQQIFGKTFDEDEVEDALLQARDFCLIEEQKNGSNNNKM